MNHPWWTVRVSSEMYEGRANSQYLHKRAGLSFSDGPSSATDVPCHTARQGLTHPPSVASEGPNCPPKEDSRVTEQGNLPTSFRIAVDQQTFHEEELATAYIN